MTVENSSRLSALTFGAVRPTRDGCGGSASALSARRTQNRHFWLCELWYITGTIAAAILPGAYLERR